MVTEARKGVSPFEVVRQCIAHLNADEFDAAAQLIAPHAVNHAAVEAKDTGPTAFVAAWKSLKAALPDWRFTIVDAVEADGRVMCRYENSRTQHSAFAGHAATGRSFVSLGLDCVRVEDGFVAEHWALLDLADMGRQLGWE